ncbi:MAG: dihydrofolate reductase family protein [Tannerellaceae bacterium]|nr:dihydrofolate reductase family protein [Tannerellaceae bacterium]
MYIFTPRLPKKSWACSIWPYQEQMTYVVSHHNWGDEDNVRFITENIIETISALRNEPGKDILLAGGGELISMLLAVDLIDEIQICYIFVILGKGIHLFPEQPTESKWKLVKHISYNSGLLMVEYQKTT